MNVQQKRLNFFIRVSKFFYQTFFGLEINENFLNGVKCTFGSSLNGMLDRIETNIFPEWPGQKLG